MKKNEIILTKKIESKEKVGRIGKEVCEIRVALRMSQQEFADAISVSRATINRIENSEVISQDIAFRLYYAMQKISENVYISSGLKEQCRKLQNYIENTCILNSMECSPIAYETL